MNSKDENIEMLLIMYFLIHREDLSENIAPILNIVHHYLLVLLGGFTRWEVSGRPAALLPGAVGRFVLNCSFHSDIDLI